MSMSDCPKCWDTPCTCGHMGYTVVWHSGTSGYDKDRKLEQARQENARLQARLDAVEQALRDLKEKKST